MQAMNKSKKLRVALLIICGGVLIVADQLRPTQEEKSTPAPVQQSKNQAEGSNHKEEGSHQQEGSGGDHEEHDPKEIDHSDPENQRRMGIFHYNEGNKLLAQGKAEQAIVKYKRALRHHPKLASAHINLSSAYLKLKNFESAENTLKALETQEPDNPHLQYNYACLYALSGKMEVSLSALKQSMRLGLPNVETISSDPDLAPLRETEQFKVWFKNLQK